MWRHITGLSEAGDTLEFSYGDLPRYPDGTIPDGHAWGTVFSHPEDQRHRENSSTFDVTYSWMDTISARNADGGLHMKPSSPAIEFKNAKFPDDLVLVIRFFPDGRRM